MSEQKPPPTIQQPSAALETSLGSIESRAAVPQPPPSTSCQFSRPGLRDLDIFLSRLTDLAAREDRHTRHRMRISSKRQIEDKEMKRNRAAENEKYHTSLANRAQEDKQRRERRTTEDEYPEIIKKTLDAQTDARPSPPLLQHIELNSVIGALTETETEQTTSTARDKSFWVTVVTVKSLRRARSIAIEISKYSSNFVTSGHSSRLDSGILRRTCE